MVPLASEVSALRAVSFRISSASKAELPHVVAYLSQYLPSCKNLLSSSEVLAQKDSDAAVVLHRFNTQLSSLLQDRTAEGRWAAIVLVKAAIESGAWETLRKSNGWVRGLLVILKKPDPPITRCLCIIALTRIFMLTWQYPTLIREITTPALPTFVSTCLANLTARNNSPDELRATLESFAQLIPHHPTIFRTHQDAIGRLLQSVFDAPQMTISSDIRDLACRVSISIHQCEPKGGATEKWEKSLVATVKAAHVLVDKTFIAIEEDWQSVAGNNPNKHALSGLYNSSQQSKDASERPVYQFVVSGSHSVLNHLRLLAGYFSISTPSNVTVSLGAVCDLLTRLLAVTISQSTSRSSIKFNRDSSREEREAVAQVLPEIHLASLEVLSAILDRYGNQLTPTLQSFIDQLVWIFHAESSDRVVKTAVYTVMKTLISLAGPTLTKQTVTPLRKLIIACCEDLLPSKEELKNDQTSASKQPQATMNADTFLKQPKDTSVKAIQFPGLQAAAWNLLPILLAKLPAKHIPVALRSHLDRTAVITRHKDAMIASTLNPPSADSGRSANSLLPLLAREYASAPSVEAILRPRMGVIETGRRNQSQNGNLDDEEEDVDMSGAEEADDEEDEDMVTDLDGRTHLPVDEAERERARVIMRPSNSPDVETETNREVEDIAHAEQNLITAALDSYMTGVAPSAEEQERLMVDAAMHGSETARPVGHVPDVLGSGKKRGRDELDGSVVESDKRRRAGAPGSVVAGENVVTMPGEDGEAAAGGDSDDDDDEFEIPQLVMGADSEDEDDE